MTRQPTDGGGKLPFAGLEPPGPPGSLRGRVLSRAREALAQEPARPDLWTRLWYSGAARVAWAACVLILIGAHLAVPGDRTERAAPASMPLALAPGHGDEDMEAIVALPSIDTDSRAVRDVLGGGPATTSGSARPEPSGSDTTEVS